MYSSENARTVTCMLGPNRTRANSVKLWPSGISVRSRRPSAASAISGTATATA
jgi:hypothetical protein